MSVAIRDTCRWCGGPLGAGARSDSVHCSQRCRQAAHRFYRGRQVREPAVQPLRFAYADPPYPGLARRYYGDRPDYAGEVDHAELVEKLTRGFDGWALSTSAEALQSVLALCPRDVRVAAWFRGERPARAYRPQNAWEPVIYSGGRPRPSGPDVATRRTDALVYVARPRGTDPQRVIGAKPAAFCWWLFDLLGALPGDELVDLFPGSGGIGRAWKHYSEMDLPLLRPGERDASRSPAAKHDASRSAVDPSRADPHDASLVDERDNPDGGVAAPPAGSYARGLQHGGQSSRAPFAVLTGLARPGTTDAAYAPRPTVTAHALATSPLPGSQVRCPET